MEDTLHRSDTLREATEVYSSDARRPAPAGVTPGTIAAFGTLLREQLKNGSIEFRKAYLNLFIDRIEVDDTEIRIRGPVSALAGGASGKLPRPSDAVPSYVREWRPWPDSNQHALAGNRF